MAMSKGMPAMQQRIWVSEGLLVVAFHCDGYVKGHACNATTGFGQQAFGDDVNNNNSFSHNNYNNYNNNVSNYSLSSS